MNIQTDPELKASRLDQTIPYFWQKRLFDFCLSLILAIVSLPIILLILIAAKIESLFDKGARGPFFYCETRMSQGRPFEFCKIRAIKQPVLKQALKEQGIVHTKPLERDLKNLTWTGRLILRCYLDELPQIYNILKGDMSFVGTRPWNPADYKKETGAGIFRKKIVTAGLVGLVQITKGHHKEFPGGDKGLDDYYIAFCRQNSKLKIMLFDLKVILLSILKIFRAESL